VAISKPAGLLSQRDHTGEASAICMAAEWLASTDRRGRAHLVHRLDRRVSGLLLVARSTKAASRLSQSFARRDVLKTYLALCDRSAHAPALASGAEGRITATLRFDPQQMRAVPVPVAAAGDSGARSVSLGYIVRTITLTLTLTPHQP
jgi:23S rRNA-/tRNA-specific pseudouridylate synthase